MANHRKQLSSVLVKPAGPDCNMACSYCFYLEKADLYPNSKAHRMSEDVLEEMIRQVMTQGGREVSFSWQGGEPTLMDLRFFEKAVEFQKRFGKNQTVGNGLQTNGILLDRNWARFLREYKFLVGISLDGPQHVHDRYRQLRHGKTSWEKVVGKAKLLLDAGVEVNALTVVNDYSVQFAPEIYDFHKSLGLTYMQFIPCVETDPKNAAKAASFSVTGEEYGQFLVTLFDLWQADFDGDTATTSIRFFDSVFHQYVGLPPQMCTFLDECGTYVVVEYNGDVYSCDFFVEPEWKLGNMMQDSLVGLLNSAKQDQFGKLKGQLPNPCKGCKWLQYCRGGCIKDRIRDPRDQNLNHFCTAYKMFFEHTDGKLTRLANEWRVRHPDLFTGIQEDQPQPRRRVRRNDPCPCGSGKKYKRCCGAAA